MAISGFTSTSLVNGVYEITSANNITGTATATDEQFLLTSSGAVRASGSGQITFTRCNLLLDDLNPSPNLFYEIQYSGLSYNADNGSRSITRATRSVNFIDSSIIFKITTGTGSGALRAIFVGDMTDSMVTAQGSGTLLFYTQPGANLDNMHVNGCTWEVNGAPASASNVRVENGGEGVVNFFLPRLDLAYLNLVNVTNTARIGSGAPKVGLYLWNRISADNTKINLQAATNEYYDGITASWEFRDRDTGLAVASNVNIIVSSDKSGTMTELGRYTTDSNGHMFGSYDSQFETTGTNQTRDTLYIYENQIDTSGTTHGGIGPYLTYDIVPIISRVEVRAFLYDAPVGYLLGDNYALTTPQGSLNPDGTVADYQVFTLNNDLNITEQNISNIIAYTELETAAKLYDAAKASWFANDGYPLFGKQGSQVVIGATDLVFDTAASPVYSYATATTTVKASTYTGGITATTGKVTTSGTLLLGGVFACDIDYQSGAGTTLADVTCTGAVDFNAAGTYTIDGGSLNEVTNSSGGSITLNLFNGATVTTNTGPNITINDVTTLTLTGLQPNTEVRVFTAGTTTEIAGVENSGTSFSANISETTVDIVIHALGYVYQRLTNVDTSANLTLPVQQIADRNYENP